LPVSTPKRFSTQFVELLHQGIDRGQVSARKVVSENFSRSAPVHSAVSSDTWCHAWRGKSIREVSVGSQTSIQLLWTGGWDSTFRLLRLLLELQRPVTPIYLQDDTRPSQQTEIETMDRIRAALAEMHPHTRALLQPTQFARVADIAPDAEIERAASRLALKYGIGSQYAWLARFCRDRGLRDIELSAECTRHGASAVLLDNVVPVQSPDGEATHRIPADAADQDAYIVFGAFSYPQITITREDMIATVGRNGWDALMGMTWFCHRPARGQPCGLCNPCLYAIEQGFGWRVPRWRRALSVVYRTTLLPLRKLARQRLLQMRAR